MIIKLEHKGDIRRFSITEDRNSLATVKSLAAKAFSLNYDFISLFYTTNEGGKREIATDVDLEKIQQEKPNAALKFTVEINNRNKEAHKPIFIPSTSGQLGFEVNKSTDLPHKTITTTTQTNNESKYARPTLSDMLASNDSNIKSELSHLIADSMKTPEFHQLVTDTIHSMIPKFVDIISNTAAKKNIHSHPVPPIIKPIFHEQKPAHDADQKPFELEEFLSETVPQFVQNTTSEITSAIMQVFSSDEDSQVENNNNNNHKDIHIQPSVQQQQQQQAPIVMMEPIVMHNDSQQQPIKDEQQQQQPSAPIVEQQQQQANKVAEEEEMSQKLNVEEDQDGSIDPFVIVDSPSESVSNAPPLVGSIISFFRGGPHAPPKEPVVPNLEELLEQLNSMGFTDREMNKRTLLFHNKYQEGLDAVIEDLLQQQATQ